MLRFIKSNWQIILILIVGLMLRLYKYDQLFMYNHDNDLASWIIKDIVVDKHFRLIGQETSTQGIFIGGLFYYLQIPFYMLTQRDPIGATLLGGVLGLFYILGVYYISLKVFGKRVALFAAAIYALSFVFVFNDREIVPTQPVIFWSFAFFWGLTEILKGHFRKGLMICAVLISLIWHLNFALILPVPLIFAAVLFSAKKPKISDMLLPFAILVVLSSPLLLFEYRHSFIQTKALFSSLTTDQQDILSGWDKIVRIFHLVSKNYYSVVLPSLSFPKFEQVMFFFIAIFVYLLTNLKKYRKIFTIIFLWFVIYFLFFSFYSKRVSEYYLSGIQFIPVILLSLVFERITLKKKYRNFGYLIFSVLIILNLHRFFTVPINKSGYLERKAVVAEIKRDAKERGYPCVSVSYITNPGYELGYRYLFWLEDMHVNKPNSNSPVYTIVFPLNEKLFPVNATFGALGLIYPEHSRYNKEAVMESCSGENSNLTDPMFGFTK